MATYFQDDRCLATPNSLPKASLLEKYLEKLHQILAQSAFYFHITQEINKTPPGTSIVF
ncbi:MAG: hypothetical protein V7K66_14255 [Nostoc sp.]